MNKGIDDKMDLRRKNLRRYQSTAGDEWQRIAKKTGFSASHLSQIMSGHRPFTERTARTIEQKLQLAASWLDQEISNSGTASQIGDEPSLAGVITAIDSAERASGRALKNDARYGRLVELVYEDCRVRGMPTESWLTRLVKLILDK